MATPWVVRRNCFVQNRNALCRISWRCDAGVASGDAGTERAMMDWKRWGPVVAAVLIAATCLSGCSTRGDDSASLGAAQVQPVQDSAVASASLPPLAGQDGSVQTADPTSTADPTAVADATGADATT